MQEFRCNLFTDLIATNEDSSQSIQFEMFFLKLCLILTIVVISSSSAQSSPELEIITGPNDPLSELRNKLYGDVRLGQRSIRSKQGRQLADDAFVVGCVRFLCEEPKVNKKIECSRICSLALDHVFLREALEAGIEAKRKQYEEELNQRLNIWIKNKNRPAGPVTPPTDVNDRLQLGFTFKPFKNFKPIQTQPNVQLGQLPVVNYAPPEPGVLHLTQEEWEQLGLQQEFKSTK